MLSPTKESRHCSVILVSLVLLLQGLRTAVSIVILITGAIVFGYCDPSKFTVFSMCSLPGNTVIATGLLLIGGSLWIGD